MNKAYILLLTLISFFIFCLAANGQERYIVEAKTLNVRSGPNVHDIVVHTLHKGQPKATQASVQTSRSSEWRNQLLWRRPLLV